MKSAGTDQHHGAGQSEQHDRSEREEALGPDQGAPDLDRASAR